MLAKLITHAASGLLGLAVLNGAMAADNVITLGASVQLTGPVANTGRYYQDAYHITVDKVNAAGGVVVDGKKYTIALKIYDNQSNVNLSVRQYTQLVTDDKVNFLLGPFASNFALADSVISEKYQIPMVQGGGASDEIYTRNFKYIFGTLAPASNYFGSTVKLLSELEPKVKKVALVYADDSFDVSVAEGTRKLLKSVGFEIAADEKFSTNATDFTSLISQLKMLDVDATLVAGHETEVLNFVRQAKSLSFSPKFYSFTVGVPTEDFRKALGKDANYAFGMTAWLPVADLKDRWFGDAQKFEIEYKQRFGYEPDYHAASGASDVEAFVMAIEKANSIDPKKVRDALAEISFDSVYGPISFDNRGQIDLPQIVIQIQDGKLLEIKGTKGEAVSPPLYPMPAWNAR